MNKERALELNNRIDTRLDRLFSRYPVITFDIDGVLAHSAAIVTAIASDRYNVYFDPNEIDDWGALRSIALQAGLSEESANEIEDLWSNPEVLRQSLPIPGAIHFLKRIYTHSLDRKDSAVYVITSRDPAFNDSTVDWFKEYAPFFPKENIFIRENLSLEGGIFKAKRVRELGSCLHFEDSEHQAKTILKECPDTTVVFLTYGKTPNRLGKHPMLIHINRRYPTYMWEIYNAILKENVFFPKE